MHSTNKVLLFVLVMTVIVSLVLAGLFFYWQDKFKMNEEIYNKKATLSAIQSKLPKSLDEMSEDEIAAIFTNQITQKVVNSEGKIMEDAAVTALGYGGSKAQNIDMAKEVKKPINERAWPVFEYKGEDGKSYYILTVRGKGLWDEIWGYLALESDMNTIAGAAFDHKGETPGLGAEIKDSKAFQDQFIGKKIIGEDGNYQGVLVRKGGAKDPNYEVDGLTGATITADGVTKMLRDGIAGYAPFLASVSTN